MHILQAKIYVLLWATAKIENHLNVYYREPVNYNTPSQRNILQLCEKVECISVGRSLIYSIR